MCFFWINSNYQPLNYYKAQIIILYSITFLKEVGKKKYASPLADIYIIMMTSQRLNIKNICQWCEHRDVVTTCLFISTFNPAKVFKPFVNLLLLILICQFVIIILVYWCHRPRAPGQRWFKEPASLKFFYLPISTPRLALIEATTTKRGNQQWQLLQLLLSFLFF